MEPWLQCSPHAVAAHELTRRGDCPAHGFLGAHCAEHPALLQSETGILQRGRSLWRSYYVEALTDQIMRRGLKHIEKSNRSAEWAGD